MLRVGIASTPQVESVVVIMISYEKFRIKNFIMMRLYIDKTIVFLFSQHFVALSEIEEQANREEINQFHGRDEAESDEEAQESSIIS